MKRKIIQMKEFEFKSNFELNVLFNSEEYKGFLVLEDIYGDVFKAELHKFDDANFPFQFLRQGDDFDSGIEPRSIAYIEDKGTI